MSITTDQRTSAGSPRRRDGAAPPRAASPSGGADRQRRRPRATAGRCLGVGLMCFLVWLLFDANQLYLSAQSAPLGSRRTVAIDVLRPIAAVTNAVGLSSLVDGANDALGRANGPGSDNSNYTVPFINLPGGGVGAFNGLPPVPHRVAGVQLPHFAPPPSGGLPPVPQPTAAKPLVLLDVGDSIGEDLGFGLGDQFSGDPLVVVHQEAVESTGLARPDYYNWPEHLEQYLDEFHPKVVVAMFGGNDAQNFLEGNVGVVFGSSSWRTDYSQRVAEIMDEVTSTGARLFWVGMPIMQDPGFSAQMEQLNSVYSAEAAIHPGVTWFSTWKLFSQDGHYSTYLTTPSGQQIQARDFDGVHLAPAGWDYLAAAMVKPMEAAWGIRLGS